MDIILSTLVVPIVAVYITVLMSLKWGLDLRLLAATVDIMEKIVRIMLFLTVITYIEDLGGNNRSHDILNLSY
jgi:hypothetical protein